MYENSECSTNDKIWISLICREDYASSMKSAGCCSTAARETPESWPNIYLPYLQKGSCRDHAVSALNIGKVKPTCIH